MRQSRIEQTLRWSALRARLHRRVHLSDNFINSPCTRFRCCSWKRRNRWWRERSPQKVPNANKKGLDRSNLTLCLTGAPGRMNLGTGARLFRSSNVGVRSLIGSPNQTCPAWRNKEKGRIARGGLGSGRQQLLDFTRRWCRYLLAKAASVASVSLRAESLDIPIASRRSATQTHQAEDCQPCAHSNQAPFTERGYQDH
jgi:hypothetical protein